MPMVSVDQRRKDMNEQAYIGVAWERIRGKFKELDAPIFKKNGDIGALAKRYDAASKSFIDFGKKKNDVRDLWGAAVKQREGVGSKIDDLLGELDKIAPDEEKSLKMIDNPSEIDDGMANLLEAIKGQQDLNKTRKAIFDNLNRLYDSSLKTMTDLRDRAKKEIDAANAGLTKANADMNNAETQIRNLVVRYEKTAFDMDRKEIADEVRKLLAEFGK